MVNLIDDLSVLTNVSDTTLSKFIPVANYSIGHAVHESQCTHSDVTEIDIWIGCLLLKIEDDCIRYKFVPSKELETTIIQTVGTHRSPIVTKIETNLQNKIDKVYKELL